MKRKSPISAKNNTKARLAILIGAFCFLYIIFSFRPLGEELHLTPDWTIAIDRDGEAPESGENPVPFKLGQAVGYFSEDGKIASCIPYSFNAAISPSFYAVYNADNARTRVRTPDGNVAVTLDVPGFPYFSEDRMFVFFPNGSGIAQFDLSGKKLWEYEDYSPITAFASSAGGSVIGFADGQLVSIMADGNIDQQYYPGGSELSAIYGAAISDDGSLVACISGLKTQRFVVSKRVSGEHPKVVFHEYLPADSNTLRMVKFNAAADMVFYNYNGGLGIADLKLARSAHIPLSGTVVQIDESKEFGLMFILSRDKGVYTVTVLEPFDQVLATTSFKADNSFLLVRGEHVFIGRDNKISRLTISKR